MLDIRFIRENPEAVKENIKKKFQEAKLPLVDQVIALDQENRDTIQEAQALRTARNAKSKQVGMLMGQSKKDPSKLAEAEALKAEVKADADRLAWLEGREAELAAEIRKIVVSCASQTDILGDVDNTEFAAAIKKAVKNFIYKKTKQNPVVMANIVRI